MARRIRSTNIKYWNCVNNRVSPWQKKTAVIASHLLYLHHPKVFCLSSWIVLLNQFSLFLLKCVLCVFPRSPICIASKKIRYPNYKQGRKLFVTTKCWLKMSMTYKLDGVGPVDNRASTDNLHHFVKRKKYAWHFTHDKWDGKCDML